MRRLGRVLSIAMAMVFAATSHAQDGGPASDAISWAEQLEAQGSDTKGRDFWAPRLEMLFAGIELSAEERAGVDAEIRRIVEDRNRLIEAMAARDQATAAGDSEEAEARRRQIREIRASLDPSVRMRAFREVLSEGKRPTYDMNRAHVSARYRKARR